MNILYAVRSTILAAFFTLPLLFISFTAFLAIALGTPGFFILFLGQLLLSITTFGFHLIEDIITRFFPMLAPLMTVATDRATLLQVPAGEVNVFPSYWMVHVLFFLSYLLANAVDVYQTDPSPNASDWQVSNRRSKAVAVMIVIVLAIVSLTAARFFLTGAETWLGFAIAFPVVAIGFGWYELAKTCGARDSDIFGIIQQMTPNGGAPTTCIYTPIA